MTTLEDFERSRETLLQYYTHLRDKWAPNDTITKNNMVNHVLKTIECESENSQERLKKLEEHYTFMTWVISDMIQAGICSDKKNPDSLVRMVDMNKILALIHYTKRSISSEEILHGYFTENIDDGNNEDQYIDIFKPPLGTTDDKDSPNQKLIKFIKHHFLENKYKRVGIDVYHVIYTKEGYPTMAYTRKCSIMDEISNITSYTSNHGLWDLRTKKGDLLISLENYFTNSKDMFFPDLKEDTNVISFKNGIYKKVKDIKNPEPEFIEYSSGTRYQHLVSCKYFPLEFTGSTETPNFDKIINYQEWSEEVKEIFYMMIGRLMYSMGYLGEKWQIIPYLIGEAGTGKSTIIKTVSFFYNTSKDVKTISNNHQTIFGLEELVEGKLVIGPEIKKNWKIEQSEFQGMVSGDIMTINKKNQKSGQDIEWKIPMLLAGNEYPGFAECSEAICRRICPFRFDKPINYSEGDPLLIDKIEFGEIPAIIHRTNLAYLKGIKEKGNRNIWEILPEQFHKFRKEISINTNPLVHFLECGQVEFGETYITPMPAFQHAYKEHAELNGFNKKDCKMMEANYTSPFRKYNLKVNQNNGYRTITGVRLKAAMLDPNSID